MFAIRISLIPRISVSNANTYPDINLIIEKEKKMKIATTGGKK